MSGLVKAQPYSSRAESTISLKRVVQNRWYANQDNPSAVEFGPSGRTDGLGVYHVMDVSPSSPLTGQSKTYTVISISMDGTAYWPWTENPVVTITIAPSPTGDNATAEAIITYNEQYQQLDLSGIRVTHGGSGYTSQPAVSISANPAPNGYPNAWARIAMQTLELDNPNHGLEVDHTVLVRYLGFFDNPAQAPSANFRIHVPVTSVEGSVIGFDVMQGEPNYSTEPDVYPYIPAADEQSMWTIGVGGYMSSYGVKPGSGLYVAGRPPWRFVVYKLDPEPVHFYQDLSGGVLPIGSYVWVYENKRSPVNGLRVAMPFFWYGRPDWGIYG